MKINNQLLNCWVRNLEVAITIIWLVFFTSVNLPPSINTLLNALSYPIIAILVILRWKHVFWVVTKDITLWLFVGYALVSMFWSADVGLTIAGNRGLLRTIIFAAYFVTRYSIKEQVKILTWVFCIAAIFSFVVGITMPSDNASVKGWAGIYPHKNYLGFAMTIGSILFLLSNFQNRRQNWLAWSGFILTFTLILLSKSSGALVCILVLLSVMPLYKFIKQHYKLRVILVSLVFFMVGSLAIFILSHIQTILVDTLGKSLEFNGRTPIWELVIKKVLAEQPWQGYGFNAFWRSDAGIYVILHTWASDGNNETPDTFNAHNGYIELFAHLGFLGVSLFVINLLTVFRRVVIILLVSKKIEFFWMLQFLLFICITNYSDVFVSLLGTNSYSSIYMSICFSTAIESEFIKKQLYLQKLSLV